MKSYWLDINYIHSEKSAVTNGVWLLILSQIRWRDAGKGINTVEIRTLHLELHQATAFFQLICSPIKSRPTRTKVNPWKSRK